TPTTTSSPAVISPTNIIQHLPIKLDRSNYLLWKSQFLPLLHAHDLYGYVDGSFLCPPQFLPSNPTHNPAYTLWHKQDQIILSWIYASLTEHSMTHVISLTSSHDVWTHLACIYAPQSQAHIMQLKYQLLQLKRVNGIVANLSTYANPISEQDTILSIFRGLGPEYDSFATSITARLDPMSLDDFNGLLLSQEILKEQAAPHLDLPTVEANLSTKSA
ncbi:LOW QUALITY PROTEIN: UBN2_3 domain-containing protein, partial [Cephalotus follicularis]